MKPGLRRHWRDLVASVFPARVALFDKLNANAEFTRLRRTFAGLPTAQDRFGLYEKVREYLGEGPIDYLEFGVWKGETLRHWAGLNSHPDSRFFGFDTFEGLPEDWGSVPRGTFDTGGSRPQIADPRVRLVVGLFQNTLYEFLKSFERGRRIVVHIDCDLYTSTLFCLAVLDRVFAPGDVLIFDEFYSLTHEFDAFVDYSRAFYRELTPLASVALCTQVAIKIGTGARA